MADTMHRQVRDFVELAVSTVEPIEMREIIERPIGDGQVRPIGRRVTAPRNRGRWVAVAAAVVAIVAIGLVPWLIGNEAGEGPTNDPTPTTTVTPTTEAVTATTEAATEPSEAGSIGPTETMPATQTSAGQLVWSRYDDLGTGAPSVQRDINGYVISGLDQGMLYSNDGVTWSTTSSGTGMDDYQYFYAEGDWALASTESPWLRGATQVLLRSNGQRWERVDLGPSPPARPTIPVTTGDTVVIDLGDNEFAVAAAGGPFTPIDEPWSYPDDLLDPNTSEILVAAPDGGVVAYVWAHDVHPDERSLPDGERDNATLVFAEVWTSDDGVTWTNHGTPSFLAAFGENQEILFHIVESNGTLLARVLSVDGEIPPLGWFTSDDGITWQPFTGSGLAAAEGNRPSRDTDLPVRPTSYGYVDTMGDHQSEPHHIRFWISLDGSTWEEIEGVDEPPNMGAWSTGGYDDMIYATFTADGGDTLVWIGHFER